MKIFAQFIKVFKFIFDGKILIKLMLLRNFRHPTINNILPIEGFYKSL
jgi:hypothetical protein